MAPPPPFPLRLRIRGKIVTVLLALSIAALSSNVVRIHRRTHAPRQRVWDPEREVDSESDPVGEEEREPRRRDSGRDDAPAVEEEGDVEGRHRSGWRKNEWERAMSQKSGRARGGGSPQEPTVPVPPAEIRVVGERGSGADYVRSVLAEAFGDDGAKDVDVDGDGDAYADENGVATVMRTIDLRLPAHGGGGGETGAAVWIFVVRPPCDWIAAAPASSSLPSLLERRRRELDIAERARSRVGDSDVIVARPDSVGKNPEVFVRDLVKQYGVSLREGYEPPRPDPRPIPLPTRCVPRDEWEYAQRHIDWDAEARFGHYPLECHLCYGDGGGERNGTLIERGRDGSGSGSGNDPRDDSSPRLGPLPDVDVTVPPKRIYLLGERNSGTTYASNVMAKAFNPPNEYGGRNEKFSNDIPVLLHKHMFRHDLLNASEVNEIRRQNDILWIMLVRNPCDWAEGMFRKNWHQCPPKNTTSRCPRKNPIWMNRNFNVGRTLAGFYESEWADWPESSAFTKLYSPHLLPVSISIPGPNFTYPHIFALRRRKLEIMRQIVRAVPRNVKIVSLREMSRAPEEFVLDLAKEFNMSVIHGYEPQQPSNMTHPTQCLTREEWDVAQRLIDWKMEGEFGYGSTLECHTCRGMYQSKSFHDRIMQRGQVAVPNATPARGNRRGKAQRTKDGPRGRSSHQEENNAASTTTWRRAKSKKGRPSSTSDKRDGRGHGDPREKTSLKRRRAKSERSPIASRVVPFLATRL